MCHVTNRFFARDVRDKVVHVLNNGGTDGDSTVHGSISAILTTIDSERSTSTPTIKTIDYKFKGQQFPYMMVDVGGSELLPEDNLATFDVTQCPEIFEVMVWVFSKGNTTTHTDFVENYIEGIIRCLNGWTDSDITWVLATETNREDVYQDNNETGKMAAVKFEVRIK